MNRYKYLLALFAGLILIISGCTHQASTLTSHPQIKSGEDMTFFITNDIHHLSEELIEEGESFDKFLADGDGKELKYMDELLQAFMRDIKKKAPDVLIVSGDLTTNGEKESHLDLAKIFGQIEDMGTSVYVIPGNHDIDNPWALEFKDGGRSFVDSVSPKEFSDIYNDYGYNEALLKDKKTLSYLAAPSEDTWLLMLDTNKYLDNQRKGYPEAGGQINEETFEWIQNCSTLAEEKGAEIIVVMHQNLLDHSRLLNENFTIDHNEDVLNEFSKANFNLALSGHVHIQDIASYDLTTGSGDSHSFIDIATSAFSVYPQNYGILDYNAQAGHYTYTTELIDVEGWAKEMGIEDDNLRNFKDYAYKSFADRAYQMAYRRLNESDVFTEEEKHMMAETFKDLNMKSFDGTDNDMADIMSSAGYKLWESAPPTFIKTYVLSLWTDEDIDDNYLEGIILGGE